MEYITLGIHNYLVFVSAAVLLNITPGPDTMYILGRSVAQGRRAGVASVLGISTGVLCHTLAAALGLSTLLATSALAFTIIKAIGAAYLVYLGIDMLRDRHSPLPQREPAVSERYSTSAIYRQGVLTNVLNPKVALFFLALLPQFVDVQSQHPPLSFILLGLTFIATGTIWCLLLVWCASGMSHYLRRNQRVATALHRATGTLFIGLGLKLAMTERR